MLAFFIQIKNLIKTYKALVFHPFPFLLYRKFLNLDTYHDNSIMLDYGVMFGNKGFIGISISPGLGLELPVKSNLQSEPNWLPISIMSAGKINFVTYNNFALFSEFGTFFQTAHKNSNATPYSLSWHQIGISLSHQLEDISLFSSIGFLQYFTLTSQNNFNKMSQSLVTINNDGFCGDFRIGAMISGSASYKINQDISVFGGATYILPFPIVNNTMDYFINNHLLIFNIGIKYFW
jgi:hypothetical protein